MKILYLAHRIPYPPNKGDKIRSFNEIKYLSRRHEIHLTCLADDPADLKYKENLERFCRTTEVDLTNRILAKIRSIWSLFNGKPLSVSYFYSGKLQKIIDHLLSTQTFDVIFCYSSQMAEYVFQSRIPASGDSNPQHGTQNPQPATRNSKPKLIMDFVDVDSEKWKQYANYTRWPLSWIYNLESKRLASYERRVAEIFDHCILVTDAEERIFNTKNPHISNVTVIANGVDLDYFSSKSQSGPSTMDYGSSSNDHQLSTIDHLPIIVFTGAMDYYANIDGVIWFSREIFPLIKKEIPEVQFYIVGSNPSKEILSLSKHNGIKVTGYVPDTREYFRKASVAVVPLRIARGIQNKILEPMAMGIPVVATSEALKGTQATLGDGIRVGDRSEDFAAQVLTLLRDIELRNRCSIEAYRYIENHHRWEDYCARLESLLLRQRVADR